MVSPVHTDRVYLTICPLILCWYENCNSKEFQSATKLVSRCLEKFGKGEFNIEGNASKNKFQLMSASLPKKAIEVRITLFDYFIDVRSTFKGRFPKLIAKAKEIYSTYCEQGRMQGAATASNAAPQNKSFLKCWEQDYQTWPKLFLGGTVTRCWHRLDNTIFLVVLFLAQFLIPCNIVASFPTTNLKIFWAARCGWFWRHGF